MSIYDKYERVIGLEIHVQLLTKSKVYSADSTDFGAMPNTQVSPITLGHPGTLPMLNEKVIEYAVKLGLACKSQIRYENQFARKNYFYADLPKGYQITQDKTPICNGGNIAIKTKDGKEKNIELTRIHLEEDAGKSIHDQDPCDSLIDLNRAGVPLLEIVSEPVIRTGEEAYQYLTEMRKLVRYLEICDGNMEEGSMRCDANISVRLKGVKEFGKKVEVKNMNSIRNVQRAIEHETKRQIDIIESGGVIDQETRSFDAVNGSTFSLRSKEAANDYRYFPEPDLSPVFITEEYIARMKAMLPALPADLHKKYIEELGLPEYDADVITSSKEVALFFEEIIVHTSNYKAASNWVMGPVKSFINEQAIHINDFPVSPKRIAQLIQFIDSGKISYTIASQQLFPAMMEEKNLSPEEIAIKNNWIIESNSDSLNEYVKKAIAKYPEKVVEYKSGKKGILGLFMGEVMKLSGGKADPKLTSKMLAEELAK
jgi:aspartyl-tRNA(Asn)/glutamyl-tRNA(Gln) amidotransferase subunit B